MEALTKKEIVRLIGFVSDRRDKTDDDMILLGKLVSMKKELSKRVPSPEEKSDKSAVEAGI